MPTIFVAGATGAIGRRLLPLLVADGWRVVGMTRSAGKMLMLRELGADPVVVDVFDAARLAEVMAEARPQVVMHQLTDLPPGLDPAAMAQATIRNARIRDEGTRNLIAASIACGVRRLVAQSIAFAYAEGPLPHREEDPLDLAAPLPRSTSVGGVVSLERQVLSAPMEAIVRRYGRLYGPGTGFDRPSGAGPVHVDDAARAALLAVRTDELGIYNVAEDDGTVSSEKAKRLLGWRAEHRETA